MELTLYKPSDVLIHELGYEDSSTAKWFRNMKKERNPEYWQGDLLTQKGRQYCLMKSQRKKQKVLDENTGVYIIQYPWNIKKIKIGWSANIFNRFKSYNTVFCGEQKLLLHIKTYNEQDEQNIFKIAESNGFMRNLHFEVFDYIDDEQIIKLIDNIKTIYKQ